MQESVLDRILADKRTEVSDRKARVSLDQMRRSAQDAPPPRDFASALRPAIPSPLEGVPPSDGIPPEARKGQGEGGSAQSAIRNPKSEIRLVAEIKKASPSKGLIRPDFDPVAIARTYEEAGASAISVLTDEKYFQGRLGYLRAVHDTVSLPVLRKDFIIDSYQVYESRAARADAILLIVAALPAHELAKLMRLAADLNMAALVEVHTVEELKTALELGARIIGINNRDLRTFETKLETTISLAPRVPADRILVSESGILDRADVEKLMSVGVDAILVGESLMREQDPGAKAGELLGYDSGKVS